MSHDTAPHRVKAIAGIVLGLLASVWLSAPASAAPPDLDQETRVAPVVVDGVELFRVRGISAYPAARRAEEIARLIEALAADRAFSPAALTVTDHGKSSVIAAGEQRIVTVYTEDAELEEADHRSLAIAYGRRIAEAVEAYRRDRRAEHLLRGAGYTLAATLALAVFLWLGCHASRRIDRVLDGRVKRRLEGLEARSLRILSAAHLWSALRGARHLAWIATVLVAVVVYLQFVLSLFPWTRWFGVSLLAALVDPLRVLGRSAIAVIPNLVFLAVVALVTRYVLKAIRLLFAGLARGTVSMAAFEPEWAWPTYRLARLLVVAFALVVAYPYIPGSQLEAFKGVSIFLGVIFSLGSTSVISNLVAGYSLIYRRAFRVGDRIRINEHVGDVVQARLLVTHLLTPKNEEVVVPNSVVLNSSVVNYSTLAREGRLILHTTVGIGYETPWRQVEAILLQAADRTDGVVREPKPFVLQKTLGDFCVTYELNVYCANAQEMPRLYTRLHRSMLDAFNEYGVQIMTPAYEGDPEQPKIVPKEQWHAAPASVASVVSD